jgi:AP-1 complex subunit sigma 1/2
MCPLRPFSVQIHFLLLFSRQGKVRLSKYYSTFNQKERNKVRGGPAQRCASHGRFPALACCVARCAARSRPGRAQIIKEATTQVLVRGNKLCNFVVRPPAPCARFAGQNVLTRCPQEWREYKLVYRRYASLYFCVGVDPSDNELITLEART